MWHGRTLVTISTLTLGLALGAAPVGGAATSPADVEAQTAALRGLAFRSPVRYRQLERSELRQVLLKKVAEQYPAAELRDYGRSLAAMGLIPPGTDLLETLLSMYDEQVAAFYDPDERTLCTFKDANWSGNLDRMLLAHELTHALQDQHFDLQKLPLKVKDNDDRVLAAMALLEGDATILMARWYATHAGAGAMLEDLGGLMRQNTAKLLAAPPYLRDTLLFPYLRGQEYVMRLVAAGGSTAVDAAFRQLPASTEQILQPGNRDEPRAVTVPPWPATGWRRIGNNVLGQFGIETLLRETVGEFRAQQAAAGWGGDRYHVYERGTNGPTGVIWASAWDTAHDAEEFEEVYREWLLKRKDAPAPPTQIRREGDRVVVRQSSAKEFLNP